MESNSPAGKNTPLRKRIVKTIVFLLVLVFIGLLIPKQYLLKDGGTVEYRAVLYTVTKWHAFRENYDDGYYGGGEQQYVVGTTIEILGARVYHDTHYAYESELADRE